MRLFSILVACALTLIPSALGLGADLPHRDPGPVAESPNSSFADGAPTPEGLSPEDWSGIREAFESARHNASPVAGGFQAWNPGQRWLTSFDGRGFSTQPRAATWVWGLELVSYGFQGEQLEVSRPAEVTAEGGRVAYAWDANLEEWFINDARGLEHGFTLQQRPARNASMEARPLIVALAVRGDLTPQIAANGRTIRFNGAAGGTALTYSGLTVFDSMNTRMDATFAHEGGRLLISIDERDAVYPLTIDPIAQQAYLKASNTRALDTFGSSVGISGETVVVGALGEDSNATGVDGDQGDDSATDSGAAYVFVRTGTSWSQQAYLKASNTEASDSFGYSVAISGDTIVVGALGEDSSAIGVDGDQNDNSANSAGAAYVFVRSGTTWSQQAYLKASNTDGNDQFGNSVAIAGDTLVVGAWHESSQVSGVDQDQTDNGAMSSGAAYVFTRNGTTWSQEAYLKASNTGSEDEFGQCVAISGETIVVSTANEDSNATGVDGDQSDNSAESAGAAYVFTRDGTTWSHEAYLKASNTGQGDLFGTSLAVSSDTVIIGAPGESSASIGVNGDQNDNSAESAGAAYVFTRDVTTWSQQAYLKASNAFGFDGFGASVAVAGENAAVGADLEKSNATGVNGEQGDNSAGNSGAAYVFSRSGSTWTQEAYLKASNTETNDRFAEGLAMSGGTLIVVTTGEDSSATGVNGDQSDNSASSSGAAYVFDLDLPPDPGSALCFGDGSGATCPCGANGNAGEGCLNTGGTGGATLVASGNPSVFGDTFQLAVSGIPGAKAGLCIKGSNQLGGGNGNTVGDGLLCTSPQLRSQVIVSSGAGNVTMTNWRGQPFGTYPSVANVGTPTYYQWWYRDPSNTCSGDGFNFANAWCVDWLP